MATRPEVGTARRGRRGLVTFIAISAAALAVAGVVAAVVETRSDSDSAATGEVKPGVVQTTTTSTSVPPPVPQVTGVDPASGTPGTTVHITGTEITAPTGVTFGPGNPSTDFAYDPARNAVRAVAPPGSGQVDVQIVTAVGTSAPNPPQDHFTYTSPAAAPVVERLTPAAGAPAGGTAVAIAGSGFTGATAVSFGDKAASDFDVVDDRRINAITPAAAAGAVQVTVSTPNGTSAQSPGSVFTYTTAPTVTSVAPAAGPTAGGSSVTIRGANLTGADRVRFGTSGDAPNLRVVSDSEITVTAPAHPAGEAAIDVRTPAGSSPPNVRFRYWDPPGVTSVTPASGPAGRTVTIQGSTFVDVIRVSVGGVAAPCFKVDSSGTIRAVVPPGPPAGTTVPVVVTTNYGSSGASVQYTYAGSPQAPSCP